MQTVAEPPTMHTHAKRREYEQPRAEEPTFVHARPAEERRRRRSGYYASPELPPPSVNAPVGAWTVIETVARSWYWIFLAGILGMLGGYFFGQTFFQTGYIAFAELMRLDPGASMEHYKPRVLTEDGFSKLLKSPELISQVSNAAKPPLNPDELAKRVKVTSDGESEIFTLSVMAASPERAVELVNLYAEEARKFTAELQKNEVREHNESLKGQLAGMDADLQEINTQMREAIPRLGPTPA